MRHNVEVRLKNITTLTVNRRNIIDKILDRRFLLKSFQNRKNLRVKVT